jgi:hypothetical protein
MTTRRRKQGVVHVRYSRRSEHGGSSRSEHGGSTSRRSEGVEIARKISY